MLTPETHTMLQFSTIALTDRTFDDLRADDAPAGVVCYPKGDYGVICALDHDSIRTANLPRDLAGCVALACEMGADWIAFDRDVATIDERQMALDLDFGDEG